MFARKISYTVVVMPRPSEQREKNQRACSDTMKKDLSLYIKNSKLQVQEDVLYRLGYTTLEKYKIQS